MKLPPAPLAYTRADQQEVRRQLELADLQTHKRNRDLEVGAARLILIAPNGARWSVTVSNTGTLSAVAV
jgi:hypothetical protein